MLSSKIFLLTVPRRNFFCGSFVLFMSCVCHAFLSVHCCLVVTCWERVTSCLSFVMFNCIFDTFRCGILGQVWYLIVSIPDHCHLCYFVYVFKHLRERERESLLFYKCLYVMEITLVQTRINPPHHKCIFC